ncbi:hypothetical protein N8I74_01775 [Chitiniphilus purpureus]|uniref:Uncharacterized protein n=1 Tax=Chitiniphilus purpureus TaxID=2981137 RepID=A0ABY6DN24_9NEIS|nr:hypothetical protein [Chitiniphilus sp. CD1]UXY15770.1 hypothetical protein N8I74_01775 [Chitiniphilus sp. CD1]
MNTQSKLSHHVDGEWQRHSFLPTYYIQSDQLIAGLPANSLEVFETLSKQLTAPLYLLYVLHTPRGEGAPGRYQSPEMDTTTVATLLRKYQALLTGDARCDLWVHSPEDNATLVLDRHNLLFAYGPLQGFAATLNQLGFLEGEPVIPLPHQHHYRETLDFAARELLAELPWRYTPLRPEDEQ